MLEMFRPKYAEKQAAVHVSQIGVERVEIIQNMVTRLVREQSVLKDELAVIGKREIYLTRKHKQMELHGKGLRNFAG